MEFTKGTRDCHDFFEVFVEGEARMETPWRCVGMVKVSAGAIVLNVCDKDYKILVALGVAIHSFEAVPIDKRRFRGVE